MARGVIGLPRHHHATGDVGCDELLRQRVNDRRRLPGRRATASGAAASRPAFATSALPADDGGRSVAPMHADFLR